MLPINTTLIIFYLTKLIYCQYENVLQKINFCQKKMFLYACKKYSCYKLLFNTEYFVAPLPSPELFLWRENVVYVY